MSREFVYFAQADYGGPIKIGVSNDHNLRIEYLAKDLPFNLVLIGAAQGDLFCERFTQCWFRNYQVKGEWFEPAPELMRWALESRNTGRVHCFPPMLPSGYSADCSRLRHSLEYRKISHEQVAKAYGGKAATAIGELHKDYTNRTQLLAAVDVCFYRKTGEHIDWLGAAHGTAKRFYETMKPDSEAA